MAQTAISRQGAAQTFASIELHEDSWLIPAEMLLQRNGPHSENNSGGKR